MAIPAPGWRPFLAVGLVAALCGLPAFAAPPSPMASACSDPPCFHVAGPNTALSPGDIAAARLAVSNIGGDNDLHVRIDLLLPDGWTRADDAGRPLSNGPMELVIADTESWAGYVHFKVPRQSGTTQIPVRFTLPEYQATVIYKPVNVWVPLHLYASVTDRAPGATDPLYGVVVATWHSGVPVAGIEVYAQQRPAGPNPAQALTTSYTGPTNDIGVYVFDMAGDAGPRAPGDHSVTAWSTVPGTITSQPARYTAGLL